MLYPLSYEGGDSKGSRLDSSLDRLDLTRNCTVSDLFHTMARAMGLE